MGVLSKSQTVVRFAVEGTLPSDLNSEIMAGLKANAISEPVITDFEDHVGWVPFEEPFVGNFDGAQIRYGDMFVFSLRIDTKTVPGKAVQKTVALRIRERKEQTGRDFVSKNEISEIKEDVMGSLMMKAPYTPNIFEFVWDVDQKVAYLYSARKKALEAVVLLFLKSFNLKLVRLIPYFNAAKGMDADLEGQLSTLTPMPMFAGV